MPRRRRRRSRSGLGIVLLLAAGIAAYLYWQRQQPGEPPAPSEPSREVTPSEEAPAPEPGWEMGGQAAPAEETAEAPLELPPLDASDALLRELAAQLSAHPSWSRWLATEGLIQRFVAAVDNVAEGKSPRRHLASLAPEPPFEVEVEGEALVLTARSARRYDAIAAAVAGLDAPGTVRLYGTLQPLVDQAYRELGYPERDFDETLLRALRRLRDVPVPEERIDLVPGVLTYEFADLELEDLNPAEKHLLRMGPRNARRIQAKLRELEAALQARPPS